MLLKIIGCLLIVVSTSSIGYWYSMDFQKHADELQYLKRIFRMISSEIQYTQAPLSEVFYHVGRRMKSPYQEWFLYLAEEIDCRRSVTFDELWKNSICMHLGGQRFSTHDMEELKELGSQIGLKDTQTQLGVFELYIERLELKIQKMREGLGNKKRLSNCLGVMSGIFIAVILL